MAQETFTLSTCTTSEVPGMIEVYNNAFSSDPLGAYIFPRSIIGEAEMHRWATARFTKQLSKREIHVFKMTSDSTGKIVAFLRWTFPHVLTEGEEKEREKEKKGREEERKKGYDPNWPVGANLELCDVKFGGLERMQEKYVKKDDMYVANLLATDPAFQRKGLASILLKHVLDMADREGRKVYIEATDAGYLVYWKLGFRDVDVVTVDLTKWGGKNGRNRIMIRDPQPLS